MQNHADQMDNYVEPRWQALLGALYFLLAGTGLMLQEMPPAWVETARLLPIDWLVIIFLLIPAIGLAAGWALGFPRWSYPYTGGLLVWSWYLMNVSTPGSRLLSGGDQVWGWRAWVPFLLACAVGFLLSLRPEQSADVGWVERPLAERSETQQNLSPAASPRPERSAAQSQGFLSNLFRDPTLATYLMFGWMPLLVFIAFDEMDRLYTLVCLLTLTVVMVATALLYQRLAKPGSRARALVAGILTCIALLEIGTIAYWLPQNGVNIPLSLAWGVVIAVVMLYPIFLSRLPKPAQGAKEA